MPQPYSSSDAYLGCKCKGGFGDVRFTDVDGVSLLPYWMETPISDNATFWVKIPYSLSTLGTTIFLYYGNSEAESLSNGTATFDFFDDFTEDTGWTLKNATINCGTLNLQGETIWDLSYANKTRPQGYDDYRFRFRSAATGRGPLACWEAFSRWPGYYPSGYPISTPGYVIGSYWENPLSEVRYITPSGNSTPLIYPERDHGGHVLQVLKSGSNFTNTWDSSLYSSIIDSTPESGDSVSFCTILINYTVQIDWVFLGKYVYPEPAPGSWGQEEGSGSAAPSTAAVLFLGTQDYSESNSTWVGGFDEKWVSEGVSNYSRNLFADTGRYGYCADYWGMGTEPSSVYDALEHLGANYEYIALFYKGHSFPFTCGVPGCPYKFWPNAGHFSVYDSAGLTVPVSEQEFVRDCEVHEALGSGTARFAFLWTCGSAWENSTGGFVGDHSYGWESSLMGRNNLSSDAYHIQTSDNSGYCYLGFANFSIWFTMGTGLDEYNYGHFAYFFFDYALQGYSIRTALDLATSATIYSNWDFDDCDLYKGYIMKDYHSPGEPEATCYLRVWGDGGVVLPH